MVSYERVVNALHLTARMVELVDTLVSGTSAFSGMEVRVFFRANNMAQAAPFSL